MQNINTIAELGFPKTLKNFIANRFEMCKNDTTYLLATVKVDPRFKTTLLKPQHLDKVNLLLNIEGKNLKSTIKTHSTKIKQ